METKVVTWLYVRGQYRTAYPNKHWFDPNTLDYFGNKFFEAVQIGEQDHFVFVGQCGGDDKPVPIRFSVWEMKPDCNGEISHVGEFREYGTRHRAVSAAEEYVSKLIGREFKF